MKQEVLTFKPVDDFIMAWKRRDPVKMLDNCTYTFRENGQFALTLVHLFMNEAEVKKYKIIEIKSEKETETVIKDVVVELVNFKKKVKNKAILTIRCIKESKAHATDVNGEWLVNPISAQRGL